MKIKSNSQPSSNLLDSNREFNNISTKNNKTIFNELLESKKVDVEKPKLSPITSRLQELKYKFLMKNEDKLEYKYFKCNANATKTKFQFINLNPLIAKENSKILKKEPNLIISSRIKSDNIRKKFNDIYLNNNISIKSNEK